MIGDSTGIVNARFSANEKLIKQNAVICLKKVVAEVID
jgi:hypothetical protein